MSASVVRILELQERRMVRAREDAGNELTRLDRILGTPELMRDLNDEGRAKLLSVYNRHEATLERPLSRSLPDYLSGALMKNIAATRETLAKGVERGEDTTALASLLTTQTIERFGLNYLTREMLTLRAGQTLQGVAQQQAQAELEAPPRPEAQKKAAEEQGVTGPATYGEPQAPEVAPKGVYDTLMDIYTTGLPPSTPPERIIQRNREAWKAMANSGVIIDEAVDVIVDTELRYNPALRESMRTPEARDNYRQNIIRQILAKEPVSVANASNILREFSPEDIEEGWEALQGLFPGMTVEQAKVMAKPMTEREAKEAEPERQVELLLKSWGGAIYNAKGEIKTRGELTPQHRRLYDYVVAGMDVESAAKQVQSEDQFAETQAEHLRTHELAEKRFVAQERKRPWPGEANRAGLVQVDTSLKGYPILLTAPAAASFNRVRQSLDRQGVRFTTNYGYRDPRTNEAVGGAEHSWHLSGLAVDVNQAALSKDNYGRLKGTFMANGWRPLVGEPWHFTYYGTTTRGEGASLTDARVSKIRIRYSQYSERTRGPGWRDLPESTRASNRMEMEGMAKELADAGLAPPYKLTGKPSTSEWRGVEPAIVARYFREVPGPRAKKEAGQKLDELLMERIFTE